MTGQPEPLDLLWGTDAIAAFIGRTPRQTWEMLNKGELPAVQPNGRWCASRTRLTAFFSGMDIGEAQSASPTPGVSQAPPEPAKVSPRRSQAGRSASVHKLVPRKGRAA